MNKTKKKSFQSIYFNVFFFLTILGILALVLVDIKSVSATVRKYPIEETVTVEPGTYYVRGFSYSPGGSDGIYVSVSVEELDRLGFTEVGEPPIDVLFLSKDEFQQYQAAFNQSSEQNTMNNSYQGPYQLAFLSVTNLELLLDRLDGMEYDPRIYESYGDLGPIYLVLENANFTYNGARASESVTVKIIWKSKLLLEEVPPDLKGESLVGRVMLSAFNLIFSINTIAPLMTGAIGIVLGYKGIPVFTSRISRLTNRSHRFKENVKVMEDDSRDQAQKDE